ncbi:MAG: DUF951 domain-containing protein [Clostridia bacterium]|nr:DUF951 domain-containing protein [Clostridia bacterium]
MDVMKFYIGDIVKLKKAHPCGSDEWTITRLGADLKIKCNGCGHEVMLPRFDLQKRVKKVVLSNAPKDAE